MARGSMRGDGSLPSLVKEPATLKDITNLTRGSENSQWRMSFDQLNVVNKWETMKTLRISNQMLGLNQGLTVQVQNHDKKSP